MDELTKEELIREVIRLKKVNSALMKRVERGVDQGSAYSLFEGNVLLAQKVRDRTKELNELNNQILAEKAKIGRVLCTLPGRTVIFDQEMQILNSFQGTGPGILIGDARRLDECYNSEFQEKLKAAKNGILSKAPLSFSFSYGKAGLPAERHFSCYLSDFGKSEYVLGIIDTTEKAFTEMQLKQQEVRLVESSKLSSLGEMAGGVAHEINNPLAIIVEGAAQIQELLDEEPLEKALLTERAQKIEHTAGRIAKIVQGLRMFSRDSSRDSSVKVSVASLVENTLSFCSERFKSHGVELVVEKIVETLSFEGRETEISQVLLNLLNNSFDAIAERSDKWIKISAVDSGSGVEIRVTDSGNGIPREAQSKIFEPFFTTKEIGKGTGLGLSISHGIVRNHQGELRLDSNSSNTCFVIALPKCLKKEDSEQVA